MLGVILCGGQSLRMGSDKGLLKTPLPPKGGNMLTHEAKTWAQTAIDKMAVLNIPVKISVNNDQYVDYATIFSANDLIKDDESLRLKGPLLGVLSSHIQYPSEDLFAFACDMPLMEPSLLKELYIQYQQQPSADAYIFTNDEEPEPLCAIYAAKGLSLILGMLRDGQLSKHSMKFMLDHLAINTIAISNEQKNCFRNFNAHAELNGM